uniref:Uncharacterized protein n=1 Tax=Arundo donax TaxID=35708 RepID=A0A0A9D5X1_ARUDO
MLHLFTGNLQNTIKSLWLNSSRQCLHYALRASKFELERCFCLYHFLEIGSFLFSFPLPVCINLCRLDFIDHCSFQMILLSCNIV